MIIEFYGLPGTGKSTIARRLSAEGEFVKIKVKGRQELLLNNLLFAFFYPLKFWRLLFLVIENSFSFKLLYYKLMNAWLDYNAKWIKARKYDKALLDQGHFQDVITLFDRKKSKRELGALLKLIPKPDKLFIFFADKDIRKSRLKERGHGIRSFAGNKYLAKWRDAMENNDKVFQKIVRDYQKQVYFINANKSVDQVFNKVKKMIG